MLMSAFILKCHKMLLMSRFDKTVMNIGYYYHQGSTNRHVDQESKYYGNKRQISCDVIKTDFCYLPRLD